jgi:copper chaperone CopZ
MKKTSLFRLVALSAISIVALSTLSIAAEKKESVKVWGNCGMCKKTIEGALTGVDGVTSASWDKKSKMLDVKYDDSKLTMKKIEEKVAASGYDTQNVKAADAAYDGLKKCCKYDRKKS